MYANQTRFAQKEWAITSCPLSPPPSSLQLSQLLQEAHTHTPPNPPFFRLLPTPTPPFEKTSTHIPGEKEKAIHLAICA